MTTNIIDEQFHHRFLCHSTHFIAADIAILIAWRLILFFVVVCVVANATAIRFDWWLVSIFVFQSFSDAKTQCNHLLIGQEPTLPRSSAIPLTSCTIFKIRNTDESPSEIGQRSVFFLMI